MTRQPITHHPDVATLMSFAAGALPEALSAVVAAHSASCAACRAMLADLDLVGASLIEGLPLSGDVRRPPSALPQMAGGRLAGRSALAGEAGPAPRLSGAHSFVLPEPIQRRFGLDADTIPWKRLGPGVWHHRLVLSAGSTGDLRLLKIAAGQKMPEHGHGGTELTLVLDGAFHDVTGDYRIGDIQDVDEDIDHVPITDPEHGCVCLVASERPARFRTIIGRLMQPFTRGM